MPQISTLVFETLNDTSVYEKMDYHLWNQMVPRGSKKRVSKKYRHPQTKNEMSQNERDVLEIGKSFVRGKRRNIPCSRSYTYRSDSFNDRTWKNKKIKKQWMKNKKSR